MAASDIFQHIAAGLGGGLGGYVDQRNREEDTAVKREAIASSERAATLKGEIATLVQTIKNQGAVDVANIKDKGKLALQELINSGKIDVQRLATEGQTYVQQLRNEGALSEEELRGINRMNVQEMINSGALTVQQSRNAGAATVANINATSAGHVADVNAQARTDVEKMGNDQDTWEIQNPGFRDQTARLAATRPRTAANVFQVPSVVAGAGMQAPQPQQPPVFGPTYPMPAAAPAAPAPTAAPPPVAAPQASTPPQIEFNSSMRTLTQRIVAAVNAKARARSPQDRAKYDAVIKDLQQQANALQGLAN